jgi:outer membrane protein assembly factor BamB
MATLEVHDGQGRVQFVDLARDHPLLFGTSQACDLVLEGPEIKPVHGRIRWKGQRFKVEASPDAEFVLINGHKMSSGSLEQGDEVAFGPCRMFLLRTEEDPASLEVAPQAEDLRTLLKTEMGERGSSRSQPWRDPSPQRPLPRARPWMEQKPEQSYQLADLGIADEQATVRHWNAAAIFGGLAAIARSLNALRQRAPGQERIISSPVVLALVVALAVLAGTGFWLNAIISATAATRTFNRGVENLQDGDYRTAIRDFDGFLAGHPRDSRAGKARVLRALANVRQYVSPTGSTWSSALQAVREMWEQTRQEPAFRDERMELAELVIRIGEGLADRARQMADAKALAEADAAVPLHAQIAGEPATALLDRSRLPAKLVEARAAVRKAQVRAQALAAMDGALQEGLPSRVYQARDDLVDRYADLAQDKDLIARMTAANELIRKAVTVDPTRRAAARTARTDPLGPPTSVVFRSRLVPGSGPPAPESIVFALSEGLGYAIDATAGAPLWQTTLGLASPFVPQPIPGDGTVLAFDARSNELVRLDARSGALKWRLELGERVVDPPLVLGNQLVQVVPSGKVLVIALESGELQATVNLGRPLARMPAHDESGRHLYVPGRQDCLFILTRDPLACSAVEYLGHADGSIPCPPARLGQYLVIPQNDSLSDSHWQVLVLDDDGARVRPVQELKVAGWTWQPPAVSGPIVWAIGDKTGFEAFTVGDQADKSPFHSVARLTADARALGPAFAVARSERELWAASGHPGRFVLDAERGSIEPKVTLPVPGPALAPIQAAGNVLVGTFEDRQSGGVALLGLEPEAGTILWKTIVGGSWPTPLEASADSHGLASLGRDGQEVRISSEDLVKGGFVVLPIPRPGEFTLPSGMRLRFERDGKPLSVLVPRPFSETLWVQDSGKRGGWRGAGLPSSPATDPVVWGDGVLIPGADGRVYLVDPVTGSPRAEPYVPQFDRDRQGTWLAPAPLDRDSLALADDAGRVRRLGLKAGSVARLIAEAETTLDRRIIADPASTGGAVLVATADHRVRSLAARDLSPVGAWPLDAPLAGPPVGLGDGGLVMDRAGGVMAFGRDGQRVWSTKLSAEVVGPPQVLGRSILLLTADAVLHVRSRSDGAPLGQHPLGIMPAAGPIPGPRQTLIPVAAGTIRPLVLERLGGAKHQQIP